jgi:hypothetical protein
LPTVLDRLFEDPVLVAEPIPHCRQLHRRHRIEKARRKAAEPAVAEPGIGFFFQRRKSVDVLLVDETPGQKL